MWFSLFQGHTASNDTVNRIEKFFSSSTMCRGSKNEHVEMELFSTKGIVRLELRDLLFDSLSYSVVTPYSQGTVPDLFGWNCIIICTRSC